MKKSISAESRFELARLAEIAARVGSDPLLTQASTGNISIKLDGRIRIKASGRWMAHALRDNLFVPLNLAAVNRCLRQGSDPAEEFAGASIETAMHAAMPQCVVLHVHSVNAIAWAVRADDFSQLQIRLEGMRWQWLPYLLSGLPLARGVEEALQNSPGCDLLVLANHGLLLAAEDVGSLEKLLGEVLRRLNIPPRFAPPPDYTVLANITPDSGWQLPADDTPRVRYRSSLARNRFRRIPLSLPGHLLRRLWIGSISARLPSVPRRQFEGGAAFQIVEKCGVLVSADVSPAALAMLSGLARVAQRLSASAPIRYLSAVDVAGISPQAVHRYCELANALDTGVRVSPVRQRSRLASLLPVLK